MTPYRRSATKCFPTARALKRRLWIAIIAMTIMEVPAFAGAGGWQPEVKPAAQAKEPAAAPGGSAQPSAQAAPASRPGSKPDQPSGADTPASPATTPGSKAAQEIKPSGASDNTTAAPQYPANRDESLVEQYCRVAVDAGVAAKLAEERRRAEELKKEIEAKLAELESATAELKKWLQLRNDFRNQATENLVSVYAEMDPEAAAQRLTVIGEPVAAAILIKLPPKSASAVLGEMRPDMAGKITSFMAGAAEVRANGKDEAGQSP